MQSYRFLIVAYFSNFDWCSVHCLGFFYIIFQKFGLFLEMERNPNLVGMSETANILTLKKWCVFISLFTLWIYIILKILVPFMTVSIQLSSLPFATVLFSVHFFFWAALICVYRMYPTLISYELSLILSEVSLCLLSISSVQVPG